MKQKFFFCRITQTEFFERVGHETKKNRLNFVALWNSLSCRLYRSVNPPAFGSTSYCIANRLRLGDRGLMLAADLRDKQRRYTAVSTAGNIIIGRRRNVEEQVANGSALMTGCCSGRRGRHGNRFIWAWLTAHCAVHTQSYHHDELCALLTDYTHGTNRHHSYEIKRYDWNGVIFMHCLRTISDAIITETI